MADRLFQGVLHQMKDSITRTVGVINREGIVVACTELDRIGDRLVSESADLMTSDSIIQNGFTIKRISSYTTDAFYVCVDGENKAAGELASVLAVTLGSIKTFGDERTDKSSFLRSVILDRILPSDINVKAREFGLEIERDRIVYLVRFPGESGENFPLDMVSNMFSDESGDSTVIAIDENSIAVVLQLDRDNPGEIDLLAKQIVDTISSDYYVSVEVGIGSTAGIIRDIARSYKEAQFALEVGKVFGTRQSVASYEKLGIGRLIYQLPTTLCEMFLHEVFRRGTFETLDEESLLTIRSFFENNLNVSETARKLFIHRNTLVYRLEKIKKLTGLDLREFESAITFKVAIMVKQYLDAGRNG